MKFTELLLSSIIIAPHVYNMQLNKYIIASDACAITVGSDAYVCM